MSENVIYEKSEDFALQIVRLYKHLMFEKKEFILSKQILRSGTSVGANVSEAYYAQSNADYIHKYSIALKEANETKYWIKLLVKAGYLLEPEIQEIYEELIQIIKILTSIILTLKNKKKKSIVSAVMD
ncbi:MAG: four helix bundle protein [Treponema sp.]|nr:four helix bundle protein [Treponema sp.]